MWNEFQKFGRFCKIYAGTVRGMWYHDQEGVVPPVLTTCLLKWYMDGELQKVKERSPDELDLGPGKHNQKGKPLEAMVINIMTRIHY